MMQYGLIEGMFKIKLSGLPDCVDEGMTLARAAYGMSKKMETDEYREDDEINLFQLYIAFSQRCNYAATMQGVVVLRQIGEYLESSESWLVGTAFAKMWFIGEFMANFMDDLFVIATAF